MQDEVAVHAANGWRGQPETQVPELSHRQSGSPMQSGFVTYWTSHRVAQRLCSSTQTQEWPCFPHTVAEGGSAPGAGAALYKPHRCPHVLERTFQKHSASSEQACGVL